MTSWGRIAVSAMALAACMLGALPAGAHHDERAAVGVGLVGAVVGAAILFDHPRRHLIVIGPPPRPPVHVVYPVAPPPVRVVRRTPPPPVRIVYRRSPAVVVVDRAPRCRLALRWDPYLRRYHHIGMCN